MKRLLAAAILAAAASWAVSAQDTPTPKYVKGDETGWRQLAGEDFVDVNCGEKTWKWTGGDLHCTGTPVGVCRTKKQVGDFELVLEWRHLKHAGNSGVFVWVPEKSLEGLKPGQLPKGIECQILDHGYAENYEKKNKKKSDWFTTNGDVFPVGVKMKPFPPLSANGSRSFPKHNTTKGFGEWNHYYIRAIAGEVRLSVNGVEVSGGNEIDPRSGYICLESEGSPIEFKNIRIKEGR